LDTLPECAASLGSSSVTIPESDPGKFVITFEECPIEDPIYPYFELVRPKGTFAILDPTNWANIVLDPLIKQWHKVSYLTDEAILSGPQEAIPDLTIP
jgi:hypothetical protein